MEGRHNGEEVLANDRIGLCVIAAILHHIEMARAIRGQSVTFTDEQAIALYTEITGYDPAQTDDEGNNPTDNGTAWTDALDYWMKNGVYGEKILGWAAIDYSDPVKLNQAIDIFGAALIGTAVYQSMENQFSEGKPWNAPFKGGLQGYHAVPVPGFGREGRTCITWGARCEMDLFAPKLFDEAYVVITQSWIDAQGKTPLRINIATLQSGLAVLRAG